MMGWLEIEADSKEDALEEAKFNLRDCELPIELDPDSSARVEYLEDSFELSCDNDEEMLELIREVNN
jgi:hypothetical protein